MIDTPQITQSTAILTAVIKLTVPRAEIQKVMGPGIGDLMSTIASHGIKPAGPLFSHHFRIPSDTFDFEIGVPVKTPVAAAGRVTPGSLPSLKVARTNYRGPYEGLGAAWGEFEAWIKAQGLTPGADLWECYVTGPESGNDPSKWCTELNRPLAN